MPHQDNQSFQDEAELRNKPDHEGDSLAEKKKMENGVDIEPEADEWVAKPVAFTESDSKKE
ncbi:MULTISPECIES: hypothetical protein [Paenibacillus]|uniref:Multidrug transporter n=1 Tax=Paenibacillus vini TaxID=1476024 RepID=A0ABQ4M933_9BACL|nr:MULTISPECIES: hypothetical protein [Paenibacillus]MBQ4901016.1 hypothetical protein [Paenibacillus sp. Marseille-P2973]MDN4070456.1 hypothetical protein [Paenibacillus vini]GIP52498.1 hypothetical protein J42TS3_15330 [Paenibacillus vini]